MLLKALRPLALLGPVFLLLMLLGVRPAAAQLCSLSVTPLAFGAVDVTAGAEVVSTATATVTCSGLPAQLVGVCLEVGAGSGGGVSATNRYLVNGSDRVTFGLFSDAALTSPLGSALWPAGGGSAIGFNMVLSLAGTGSVSRTIYGRLNGGQMTARPLAYSSTFSGSDVRIRYGLLSFLLGCDLLTVSATASFLATADVQTTCVLAATGLDFGNAGLLAGSVDAGSTLSPVCTNGTPYAIGLDGGLSGAPDPTQRRMTKGAETIRYGLYRDAARVQPFGQAAGVNTVAGTGTGLAQNVPVYGRVPSQPTPSPGLYSDTVVATLTY